MGMQESGAPQSFVRCFNRHLLDGADNVNSSNIAIGTLGFHGSEAGSISLGCCPGDLCRIPGPTMPWPQLLNPELN